MQFAVFEPNTEMLWATVKQSISNFLIGIWRSGGLEGVKQEEAFFVNVGYNLTMTQTDIDNGRLDLSRLRLRATDSARADRTVAWTLVQRHGEARPAPQRSVPVAPASAP